GLVSATVREVLGTLLPPESLNVPVMFETGGGVVVRLRNAMLGSDMEIVRLLYVPAGTVLNPSRVRRPRSRAKSTVVGAGNSSVVPSSLRLVKVTLNESTDGRGASPPVTKTLADWAEVRLLLAFPPPHPATKVRTTARVTNKVDPRIE